MAANNSMTATVLPKVSLSLDMMSGGKATMQSVSLNGAKSNSIKVDTSSTTSIKSVVLPTNTEQSATLDSSERQGIQANVSQGGGTRFIRLQSATVTSDVEQQIIYPNETYNGFDKITVNKIPDNYADVQNTQMNVTQDDVLSGKMFYTKDDNGNAVLVEGNISSNEGIETTLDITDGNQSVIIPRGTYISDSEVKIILESQKTITPNTDQEGQLISPADGEVLSTVLVNPIPLNYGDVTKTDATADDVLEGKTLYVQDSNQLARLVTGTIKKRDAVKKTLDTTANNQSVVISSGAYNEDSEVEIALETKSVTPSTDTQSITPTDGKVLSEVTVNPIPSKYGDVQNSSMTVTQGDVLSGKTFYSKNSNGDASLVSGSMANNGVLNKTLDVTTGNQSVTVSKGAYTSDGSVNIVLEEKVITPTVVMQEVIPTTGKVLSKVTVDKIPLNYGDITQTDVTADDVLEGKSLYITNANNEAQLVSGTIKQRSTINVVLDATENNQSITINSGAYADDGEAKIVLEEKTTIPSTDMQSITPTSGKVLSKVTVNPIPLNYGDITQIDATADDVVEGKSIYVTNTDQEATKITGTIKKRDTINLILDATDNNQSAMIDSGVYSDNGEVKIVLEEQTATPNTDTQTITPTTGKVMSKVTINPIPLNFGDVTNTDAVQYNVLSGKKFCTKDSEGNSVLLDGTMFDNGSSDILLDADNTEIVIHEGYHNGSGKAYIQPQSKTVNPKYVQQTISPDDGYLLNQVIVSAIPNESGDIQENKIVDASAYTSVKVTPDDGYIALAQVTINQLPLYAGGYTVT